MNGSAEEAGQAGPVTGDAARSRISIRLRRWAHVARQLRLGTLVLVAAVAVTGGILLGRQTAPDAPGNFRRDVEQQLMPLAFDADGIWTAGPAGHPSVSEALVALQRDGDRELVLESVEAWLAAYDAVLAQLTDVEVVPEARTVQRQLLTGITLSRDAVEVLGRAARIEGSERRADLLTEVGRLRARGEQSVQSAQASLLDLEGTGGGVAPLRGVPSFPDLDAGDATAAPGRG